MKNNIKNEQLTMPNVQWREAPGYVVFVFQRCNKFFNLKILNFQ